MYLRDILGEEKYAEYDQRRMQLMAEEMEKDIATHPDTYPQEAHTLVIAQAEFLSARILSSRTKLRYYSVGREEIGPQSLSDQVRPELAPLGNWRPWIPAAVRCLRWSGSG